jgi:hypothetical protein
VESGRRRGAVLPARQVIPTPKPFWPDGSRVEPIAPDRCRPAIAGVVAYAEKLGAQLLGVAVHVSITNNVTWPFSGAFGDGRLALNLGHLGHRFKGDLVKINEPLIHEFGHYYSENHLSMDYYEALCRLGSARAAGH